jgi:hypothetical protein
MPGKKVRFSESVTVATMDVDTSQHISELRNPPSYVVESLPEEKQTDEHVICYVLIFVVVLIVAVALARESRKRQIDALSASQLPEKIPSRVKA